MDSVVGLLRPHRHLLRHTSVTVDGDQRTTRLCPPAFVSRVVLRRFAVGRCPDADSTTTCRCSPSSFILLSVSCSFGGLSFSRLDSGGARRRLVHYEIERSSSISCYFLSTNSCQTFALGCFS